MANAIYPLYKQALLTTGSTNIGLSNDDATDGPFCSLIDTGTTAYSASHDFYDDVVGAVVGGAAGTTRIVTPTVALGVFDGADLTFTAITGASIEALIIYRHNSGANTTWKLVAFLDTSITGLPVTPNGGNITVAWHASGIFAI